MNLKFEIERLGYFAFGPAVWSSSGDTSPRLVMYLWAVSGLVDILHDQRHMINSRDTDGKGRVDVIETIVGRRLIVADVKFPAR